MHMYGTYIINNETIQHACSISSSSTEITFTPTEQYTLSYHSQPNVTSSADSNKISLGN